MLRNVLWLLALGALAGCGPSLNHRPVSSKTFAAGPNATCGQELATARFVAKGAKWGESVRIESCALRGFGGNYELSFEWRAGGHQQWSGSFGASDEASARCGGGEVVATADAPGAKASGGGSKGSGGGASSGAAAAAAAAPPALMEISDTEVACPTPSSWDIGLPPLKAGSVIEVRLWSRNPRDLAGAIVRLTHSVDEPNVSDEEWKKHLAKEDEEAEKRAREAKAGPQSPSPPPKPPSDEPKRPPPPPQAETKPPSPSAHAEWQPGHWHWSGGDWRWIAGRWQVPQADVGALVMAPYAPPALKAEVVGSGAPGLVWVPGYWAWDGRTYVWAAGGWAVPPRAGAAWRSAGWRAQGSRVVFVPGGWAAP